LTKWLCCARPRDTSAPRSGINAARQSTLIVNSRTSASANNGRNCPRPRTP
jgi:hypothetical protein